jgi:enoyl-CoA hydratase/carnithine racemase
MAFADGVADIRFNRPDKLNALDAAQMDAIIDTLERLGKMSGLRCIVVSGAGRAFCAGIDLDYLAQVGAPGALTPRSHGLTNRVQQLAYGWRTLPVPVIAAVQGAAFGGGFQIMLGADIRIAAPGAQFALMEARWGLVPDMGGVALLRGLVRDDVARELTYTARKFGADEAAALGLITRIADDPHAAALALARQIANTSPDAIRAAKRLFSLAADAPVAEILLAEAREQETLLASANHKETIRAHLEKRAPVFHDV